MVSSLDRYVSDAGRLLDESDDFWRLNEMMSTGIFDMRPAEESLATKAKNRKWKVSKKEREGQQDSDT